MIPFLYPARPVERKHGPRGYADISSFRDWLRDEFSFRCVYCLDRERWQNPRGKFAMNHFLPVADQTGLELAYDNLVYSCAACNLSKAARVVPDPTQVLLRDDV